MSNDEMFGLGFCIGVILCALISVMSTQRDVEMSRDVAGVEVWQ